MGSWSLEIVLVTRRLREEPGAIWRPEGRGGARRFSLDPEIILGSRLEPGGGVRIQRFYDRSGDLSWNPEVSRDWTLRSCKNMGYPLRSGDRIRTLVYLDPEASEAVLEAKCFDPEIADWNPEAIWEPVGSSLDFINRTRNHVRSLGFPLENGCDNPPFWIRMIETEDSSNINLVVE
ncbi:hypothetical protein F2Q69_00036227 [Brassica cretica]|uniref:Uncharacterized protein n=1 Tax=Brassica cretica TaxID=69181 RepID=A0A8S9SMF4_BRACR|nr:hypothetical protein F2Q69_00036227 [Brassica cretica]